MRNFKIISITINIYEYLLQNYKLSLYHTSFDFLLERLICVLPNNKNIILSAEQAVKFADRGVCVLQTRTIPQGVSAMLASIYFCCPERAVEQSIMQRPAHNTATELIREMMFRLRSSFVTRRYS